MCKVHLALSSNLTVVAASSLGELHADALTVELITVTIATKSRKYMNILDISV